MGSDRLPAALLAMLLALGACSPAPADRLAEARRLADQQDRAGAILLLKSVIQEEPMLARARWMLGATLLDNGEVAAAQIELDRALALGQPLADVAPLQARALLAAGKPQAVINQFGMLALAEAQPTAALRTVLAQAHATLGDWPAAREQLAQALRAVPGHEAAMLLSARVASINGDAAGALKAVDELLAAQPGSADAWLLKGDLLNRHKAAPEPIDQAYRQAIALRPLHPAAHGALISLQLARRDLPAARLQLQALQQALPKHPQTLLYEGQLAFAEGKLALAHDRFQTLLRGTPDNLMLLQSAAAVALQMQAPAQAEPLLIKGLQLAPDSAATRRLLGRAQLMLGQLAKALATLDPLIGKASSDADALQLAAQARLLGGEDSAAAALFERARKLKPEDAGLRTAVALSQFARGQTESAIAELRSVAASDSGQGADLALISAELRRKSFDGALQAIAALARKQPDAPLAPQLRGQVLLRQQDSAGARAAFELALQRDPGYLPAVLALAGLDLQARQPEQARARFDALLKAKPGDSAARLALAEVVARSGASREAVAALLDEAIQANPADLASRLALVDHHLATFDAKAALAAAQAALAQLPDRTELLLRLGRLQLSMGDHQQAGITFNRLITLQARLPEGLLGLAESQAAGGDLAGASRSARRALDLAPLSLAARRLAIRLALRQTQPAQALAIAQELHKLQPADAASLVLEAEIEITRKRWDAALLPLRKALGLADPAQAPERLHQVLRLAGRAADADAFASQWQGQHPADATFLFYLGDQALAQKDLARAEARYQAVLKLKPEHALSLNNIAWIRLQDGKPDALAYAERAVAAAPNMPALLDTLALALAADKQAGKAIDLQLRALAMRPADPFMRLNLARFYAQAGDKRKAKAELDRLEALGEGFAKQGEVAALSQRLGGR